MHFMPSHSSSTFLSFRDKINCRAWNFAISRHHFTYKRISRILKERKHKLGQCRAKILFLEILYVF